MGKRHGMGQGHEAERLGSFSEDERLAKSEERGEESGWGQETSRRL